MLGLHEVVVKEFATEVDRTAKVLSILPADQFGWRPHPKSWTVRDLASHLATIPQWSLSILTMDVFTLPDDPAAFRPPVMNTGAEIAELYRKQCHAALAALKAFDPIKWTDNWSMYYGGQKIVDDRRYEVFRTWVINHSLHHRGQLTVYLRLLNVPLPELYGPTADSPKN